MPSLGNDIGNMLRARRITGLMVRTLNAKNTWPEGQSFRDISHGLACQLGFVDRFSGRELQMARGHPAMHSCPSSDAPLLIALALSALPCHAADQAIEGAHGIVATIDQKSGRYEVRSRELNWTFTGQLGDSASNLSIKNGQDRLGAYRELSFSWRQQVPLNGSIRTYVSRPVVLFGITSKEPSLRCCCHPFSALHGVPERPASL